MNAKLIEILKNQRKEKGYSQKAMAGKLNISHTAYSKIENGQTKLTVDRFEEIANILGIDIFELLRETTIDYEFERYRRSVGSVLTQYEIIKQDFNTFEYEYNMLYKEGKVGYDMTDHLAKLNQDLEVIRRMLDYLFSM